MKESIIYNKALDFALLSKEIRKMLISIIITSKKSS